MKNNNFNIAESAINLLKDGINNCNKSKITMAYSMITEDDNFTWDNLDVLYSEWEDLIEIGNNILYDKEK